MESGIKIGSPSASMFGLRRQCANGVASVEQAKQRVETLAPFDGLDRRA
jgi:hypothetical protein